MRKIEFNLPSGFAIPEGKQVGSRVKVMAEIELKPNGRACLAELDGVAMPGYQGDDYKHGYSKPPGMENYNREMEE